MSKKLSTWSEQELEVLKNEYPTCSSVKELASRLGKTYYSLVSKARDIGISRYDKVRWTEKMDKVLIDNYPSLETKEVADKLGLRISQVMSRVFKLRLRKNDEIKTLVRSKGAFKKGHIPFNKGKKQHEYLTDDIIEKSMRTRFKKGHIPVNLKSIGYERINIYGYVEVKTEKGFVLKHRMIWERHNGPIPKGHIVRFKNGNKQDSRIENLELVTCSQNMKDNTIHNYPPEIKTAIRSIANINRRIKKYEQTNNRQTE